MTFVGYNLIWFDLIQYDLIFDLTFSITKDDEEEVSLIRDEDWRKVPTDDWRRLVRDKSWMRTGDDSWIGRRSSPRNRDPIKNLEQPKKLEVSAKQEKIEMNTKRYNNIKDVQVHAFFIRNKFIRKYMYKSFYFHDSGKS